MVSVPFFVKAINRVHSQSTVARRHNVRFAVSVMTPVMARFRALLRNVVLNAGRLETGIIPVMEASTAARILVRWHAWTIEVARLHIDPAMVTIATGHLPATKPIF